jgi:hypothetical protein
MNRLLAGAALAASLVLPMILGALASTALADEVYQIDSQVWGHYQKYLRDIDDGNKPGAFVITSDGTGSYYVWCDATRCMPGGTYSHDAKTACEREYGTECVTFAVRDDIRVQYEVRKSTSSSSAAPELAPAPMTEIAIGAEVQAEIDKYLRNATGGGKAWALAIAKNGAKVGTANCATTGGGGYFGGGGICDLNKGTAQELATREALKRCGGIDECVLLYNGQQKVANIALRVTGAAKPLETAPDQAAAPAPVPPAKPMVAEEAGVTEEPAQVVTTAPAAPVVEAAAAEPPKVAQIAVTAAVKAEIDAYLAKVAKGGRVWALALARDGSAVASASCPLGGSYSGGRACEPVKGSAQELAGLEAVRRCGGAAACMPLYAGAQKTSNFEIVLR